MLTEIDVPNREHELYPGMYANVTLELQRHSDSLEVPESTIGGSQSDRYVTIVKDGRVGRQPVSVGLCDGSDCEVTNGLGLNDELVAAPDPSLTLGEVVNVARLAAKSTDETSVAAGTK